MCPTRWPSTRRSRPRRSSARARPRASSTGSSERSSASGRRAHDAGRRGTRESRGARRGDRRARARRGAAANGGDGSRGGGPARGAVRADRRASRRRARPRGRRGRHGPRTGAPPLTVSQAEASYPVTLQQRVDAYLAELTFAREPATGGLEEAMRYSLLAGGKRFRPVLVLATAEAIHADPDSVLPMAAAIELIHTYSLIHDDLPAMDDDRLRRGRPTCHVAFGEDVAILAGDGLFAEAMRLVVEQQEGPPERLLAALASIVDAAGVGGMVGGQYVDVTVTDDLDPGRLRHLHELKTGRLIASSVECVLELRSMTGPATIALRRFAAELGVLFQIVDDILDVTGNEAALGKSQGSDERHGKRTYVSVFGLERARELAGESHANARAALSEAGGRTGALEQITDYTLTRRT